MLTRTMKVLCAAVVLIVLIGVELGAEPAYKKDLLAEQALADACRLSGYDCAGVEPPIIRYADFIGLPDVAGVHFGGRVVYVNESLKNYPDVAYVTLVHETVHYLQEMIGGHGAINSLFHLCVLEREAYSVSNALMEEMGKARLIATSDSRCMPMQPATKVTER